MEIIQIIILIFVLFALSRSLLRFKDKSINLREFMLWLGVWTVTILIALYPQLTGIFSNILGVENGINVLVYLSIIALFYLVFRVYVKADQIDQDLTKIVRELAKNGKK